MYVEQWQKECGLRRSMVSEGVSEGVWSQKEYQKECGLRRSMVSEGVCVGVWEGWRSGAS